MKKQYALIGKTLSYSHSPLIHNTLFKALGAEAEYGLLELSPESLAAGLECVRAEYCGCNVTVPYKQAVIPFLDEISGEAAAVGAVNTIVNQNGRLSGLNTDGEGFMRSLPVSAEELKGKRVLVCGAGGGLQVCGRLRNAVASGRFGAGALGICLHGSDAEGGARARLAGRFRE